MTVGAAQSSQGVAQCVCWNNFSIAITRRRRASTPASATRASSDLGVHRNL